MDATSATVHLARNRRRCIPASRDGGPVPARTPQHPTVRPGDGLWVRVGRADDCHVHKPIGTGKGSPYSTAERRVPELIPVLGIQPAGDVSHKPGGRQPLLSTRPAVTPATLKTAATNFCCFVNRGTMVVNSLPKTVTRQRRGCDLNPGPSAPESSTLTTRLPSHRLSPQACRQIFILCIEYERLYPRCHLHTCCCRSNKLCTRQEFVSSTFHCKVAEATRSFAKVPCTLTQHIRLLRTVKPQLYTRIKQSARLNYIKVNTYCDTTHTVLSLF